MTDAKVIEFDLQKIKEKAGDQKVALVKEGPISYVVLNDKLNLITIEKIQELNKILDKIEADPEVTLMVTLSTNPKIFSGGYDKKQIMDPTLSAHMSYGAHKLYGRFLTMNLPTICLTSGPVIGSPVFIALCHDYTISIESQKAFWKLPEFEIGLPISRGLSDVLRHTLTPAAYREFIWGENMSEKKMKELDVITELCQSHQEVAKFLTEKVAFHRAQSKMYRHLIKDTKQNIFKDLHAELQKTTIAPHVIYSGTDYPRL